MKAIITKYLPATSRTGSRYSAEDEDGNKVLISGESYACTHLDKHANAARALCEKMGWEGTLRGGSWQNGYAWVFQNSTMIVRARAKAAKKSKRNPRPAEDVERAEGREIHDDLA